MADYEYYYEQYRRATRSPATPQRDLVDFHSTISSSTYNIWSGVMKRPITTTYIDGNALLGLTERPHTVKGSFPKGKSRRKPTVAIEKKVNTGDTFISLVPVDKINLDLATVRSEKTRSPLSMATVPQSATARDIRQRSADTRSTRIYSAATTVFDDEKSEAKFFGRCATSHTNSAWVRRYKSINESQALTDLLRDQTFKDKMLLKKLPAQHLFHSASTASGFASAFVRRRRKSNDNENRTSPMTVPYGPRSWPIFGNILQLGYRPYETLCRWSKMSKYGPIFRLQLGSQTVVVLNSAPLIREALHDHSETFAGRPYLHMIHETLHGKGVISAPYGREFQAHKKFLIQSFNQFGRRRRSSLESSCLDQVRFIAEKIREKQSIPFSIGNMLSQIACNNICTLTFGGYFETMNMNNLFEKINENFNQTATIACFNFLPFTRKFRKNIFDNVNDCNRVIQKLVGERETNFDHEFITNIVDAYLDEMTENRQQSTYFSKENLDSLVQDLFVAGTDTVSNTLNWTIFYIVAHPTIQKNIHEEIDHAIGKDRPPCDSDRSRMSYIEAVLLESMRCHCAGPILLPRATTQDITFHDYFIPKNTFILVNMWSAMKDEQYWPEPEKFDPERFLDENRQLRNVNHPAMMPFSVGKRACTGEQIAKIQLFLVLVSLFQKFEFRFANGWIPTDLRGQPGITLRPPKCQYEAFVR
ncbi:unnamed protein product [Rotaria magnacalcarata]|uniref:Cytochrome P450 n=1 Tax=Rotaria magnacalcarata TaxID=392030 RepID=A0A815MD50_9BILA|nr:unnamed protein product [Rotaria magnacalcarata]CAF1930715.1 unnamed protein product [Rotaria magnacalcarata]